jgi:hypothetical protein
MQASWIIFLSLMIGFIIFFTHIGAPESFLNTRKTAPNAPCPSGRCSAHSLGVRGSFLVLSNKHRYLHRIVNCADLWNCSKSSTEPIVDSAHWLTTNRPSFVLVRLTSLATRPFFASRSAAHGHFGLDIMFFWRPAWMLCASPASAT